MGLFDKIFGNRQPRGAGSRFATFDGYTPIFTSWSGSIYENELVRSAIDARARNFSKLMIEFSGTAKPSLRTSLGKAPNPWQTWAQFLYRLSTIRDVKGTAFVLPIFDEFGAITGITTNVPTEWELVEFAGVPYLRLTYETQEGRRRAAVELSKVGIFTRHQYASDFFGSSNAPLQNTMELLNLQQQGTREAIQSGAAYRFFGRVTNKTFNDDLVAYQREFNTAHFSEGAGGGFLAFPNNVDSLQQITTKPYVLDAEQMTRIDKNVYNYYGVNEKILQNSATGDDWAAFYEGAIEPAGIQLAEILTRMLFTPREIANGAAVTCTANRMQYLTNADKLAVSAQMADRGLMTRNEIRTIWNLSPLPDDIGNTLPIRGEYYDLTKEKTNAEND